MVPFPPGTRGKDVVCDYTASRIKFGLKGQPALLDKAFSHRVKTSECSWTIGTLVCCRLGGSAGCSSGLFVVVVTPPCGLYVQTLKRVS